MFVICSCVYLQVDRQFKRITYVKLIQFMKQLFLLILFIFSSFCYGQKTAKIKSASTFFPKEKTKVLVVGTFHFDYPNLDENKTEDKVDVLTEPKKTEVTELINNNNPLGVIIWSKIN
jgi:hypothetical protein